MGIKQLSQLIVELAPNAIRVERVNDWTGKKLAIDVSNYIYQFAYKAENKKPNSHLAGFFQLVYELTSAGILPVMILDGVPLDAKNYILEIRHTERERTREQINNTVDDAVAKNLGHRLINVTSEMWNEARELFDLLGVPVLQAEHEADALASNLCRLGIVDGVISEDLDHLAFGCNRLIRDFNNKRDPDCRVYRLDSILEGLQVNYPQFVDICILCGCDYTAKIEGIARKRAVQLIREFGSIEGVLDGIRSGKLKKFKIPEEFNFEAARDIFREGSCKQDPKQILIRPSEFHEFELKKLLTEKCKYRETTLEPKFKAIVSCYQKFNKKIAIPKPVLKIV